MRGEETAVRLSNVVFAVLACAAATTGASATVIWQGNGTGSGALSASADFSLSGGDLVVRLTNTGAGDVLVPTDVLTAIFFDVSGGGVSLTRESAVLGAGSSVFYDPDGQPAGGVVGGEWAYLSGLSGGPGSRSYGISSTGLSLFGPGDRFPGPDLQPPTSPDGLQYGILSTFDNTSTGNSAILNSGGLIKDTVVFTLSGAGAGFDLNRITNVFFLYGTALGEGGYGGHQTPAPGAMALLGIGGLFCMRRRRR